MVWGYTPREWLEKEALKQDFYCVNEDLSASLDYIHRQTEVGDLYFIRNKTIQVPGEWLISGRRIYIDLCDVQALAEVYLN